MSELNHEENRKYYVYALIDPRLKVPFYIGKGINNRVKNHFRGFNLSINSDETIDQDCLSSIEDLMLDEMQANDVHTAKYKK